MAKLLCRGVDNAAGVENKRIHYRRGDVVSVHEDDWTPGRKEVPPRFEVVNVDGPVSDWDWVLSDDYVLRRKTLSRASATNPSMAMMAATLRLSRTTERFRRRRAYVDLDLPEADREVLSKRQGKKPKKPKKTKKVNGRRSR